MYVTFFAKACQHIAKSKRAGRPIFEEKIYVRIIKPGGQRIERPMQSEDKLRFADAWNAYQKGHDHMPEGTPLNEWSQITLSEAEGLKSIGVRTVEELASANNAVKKAYGRGIIGLITKARAYLKAEREPEKMAAQLRELQDKSAMLERELADRAKAMAKQAEKIKTLEKCIAEGLVNRSAQMVVNTNKQSVRKGGR